MMKKVMNTIGAEGREKVISHLNADDFQKLMDCLESVCEMTDFRSMMKKITPIIKKVSGAKVASKLMSMYIGDGNEKESSNKGAMDAVMTLPYYHPVPDGLRPGMAVYVQGAVPEDSKGFSVDFTVAKLQRANIACHFNPRFKWGNKVVFNTFEFHRWKKEEIRKMPFQKGEHFEAIFIVTEIGYQILVNGKHFYVFRHRIPAQGVRFIKVEGDLELQSVNVTAGPMVENMTRTFPGIYHLALPHEQTVLGGLYPGMSVYVNGTVPEDSHSFGVDFACCQHRGADVPLHFNPRFFQEDLVLNTFQSDKWGKEEKHQNPFQKGEPFEIIFTVTETEYQIQVNGNPFCNYSHRFPPQSVQLIRVVGDLDLQSLNVTAGPKMENRIMTFPAIYNPPVPYTGDIPGDLGAERTITVRGSIPKNGKRFEINFMAGQDIALHVELRMKPWRAVVRNSFLNGDWENEERKLTFYPFQPGQDFKLSIHCDNREFKFYANDQPFFDYTHRYVPIKQIRTLEIDGDVTLSYIKY
ncbi:galectin-4-like [Thamnophis elegans]|uniref:galectin-4-like n=1 Tax=Thamnophis elegans TaxID=35005 RepID=UPI001376FA17|nr:galectin-4-like [Thamnophis elegans]